MLCNIIESFLWKVMFLAHSSRKSASLYNLGIGATDDSQKAFGYN
jgi:hypothetical protein